MHVVAGVDVGEVVRRARLDLQRVAEDLDVAAAASASGRARRGTRARRAASRSSGGRRRGAAPRLRPRRRPGRGKSSMLESQARSSIRWSKSIAQPSVTALSPRRFSSIFRFGSVKAKCSVWPASWKSAYQSSGPPCGWITSITLPGISIGAQNARGLFVGRSSTSRWTLLLRIEVDAEIRRACRAGPAASGRPGRPCPSWSRGRSGARRSARPRRARCRRARAGPGPSTSS